MPWEVEEMKMHLFNVLFEGSALLGPQFWVRWVEEHWNILVGAAACARLGCSSAGTATSSPGEL